MEQWSHLLLEAGIGIIGFAALWGSVREQIKRMKEDISALRAAAQTPQERETLRDMINHQLESHERLDDERFRQLHQTLENKLDTILKAVVNNGHVK